MKKKLASTKCTVILKKSLYSDGWRLILLSYPVFVNGKATRKYESINRIISTPIWEKCSTGSIKKPKRDRNGIIQCTSEIDQSACRYADNFRIARQQEYDKTDLFTDVEKEITEREERGNQDFVEYFKSVIKKIIQVVLKRSLLRGIGLLRYCPNTQKVNQYHSRPLTLAG